MNIECRNAQNRFDKPILSVFVNSNDYHLNSLDTNYNGLKKRDTKIICLLLTEMRISL